MNSTQKYDVVAGLLSPVSDGYKKKGLLSAAHRCEMAKLALESINWVNLNTWESDKPNWTPTYEVLCHHRDQIKSMYGEEAELMLLCGGDIIETFIIPGVWKSEHIDMILGQFGLACIKRMGSNPDKTIYETDLLYKHRHNIHLITDWITNDISSTKIRRAVSRNESVKYLVQDNVLEYIKNNKLYTD